MGGLKDLLTNWMFPNPEREESEAPADDGRRAPRENRGRPTQASAPASAGPPNPPEPARRVTEELPELIIMPQGPETLAGRYPDRKPAQAMASFLNVPNLPGRWSYDEVDDSCWVISFEYFGIDYAIVAGCFAEPDGTPVIVLTYLAGSEHSQAAPPLLLVEETALRESAHSIENIVTDGWIRESVASGALRQLRPSEVRSMPSSAGR